MEKKERVLAVLAEISGQTSEAMTPEKDLVADLEIDSPKALRLLVELEDAFGIEIPDEDAARMSTVGDVLAYVDSHA